MPGHFPNIQAAIDSSLVKDGDVLRVLPGLRTGATVTKAVALRALGGVTIVNGPVVNSLGKAGFLFPGNGAGSGATVDGFVFEGVAFPVFSRGANDVSVTRNTMLMPNQGVTNWANGTLWGKGWDITHNAIVDLRTSCGGGIGILIGDYTGGTVTGNVIAHNDIRGRVRVPSDDCGGYDAPGIVLFADWRYAGDPGATITGNRVTKNRVSLSSTRAALVPVSGVELSDTRNDPDELDIKDNAVVYNDLRGLAVPVALTPDELPLPSTASRRTSPAPRTPTGRTALSTRCRPRRAQRRRPADPDELPPLRQRRRAPLAPLAGAPPHRPPPLPLPCLWRPLLAPTGPDRGHARAAAGVLRGLPGVDPPKPRTAALPVSPGVPSPPPDAPGGLGPPPEGPPPGALSGLDRPPDAPAPPADLRALDQELARRRSQTLPH